MPAFREASWDEALDLVASRLKAIKTQHGSGALAGFGSAKCSNEELSPPRIHDRHGAVALRTSLFDHRLEHRRSEHRPRKSLCPRLRCSHAHAYAGKRARAVGDREQFDIAKFEAGFRQ